MDRAYFMGYCVIGVGGAMAAFFPLSAQRIASIRPLVWWLCLILGVATCGYGLSHSTAPSFATRITAVGRTYDYIERRLGRDTHYGFRFVPDVGPPLNIETAIIIPGWGNPATFNGRAFRIVYLADDNRTMKNEAIDVEILSGKDRGYHESLDARPVGKWLGVPLGAALGTFGLFGLRFRKDHAIRAASDGGSP